MRRLLALLLVSLSASAAVAQTHEEYEVVLLPIASSGQTPGAHGSLWVTEFTVYNGLDVAISSSDRPSTIWPLGGCFSLICVDVVIPAHSALKAPIYRTGSDQLPGSLLKVRRDLGDDIAFQLRIQDVSRQALTWGTEIPVVRERDLYNGPIRLLDVPFDERFRQTLRVYDPLPHEGCVVVGIRYFDMESGETLHTEEATLARDDCRQQLGSVFPNVFEAHDLAGRLGVFEGTVGIEITPLGESDRIWAFVSVTNNETQHVTVVTPQ